ncbi:MAG: hypothetical protein IPL79_12050 [Myxococcales bacterium]|nr:hypothetical protein [Myxococcales bacterium]
MDWRYDEFRVDAHGRVEHEIEWSGANETARWLIVASDVIYSWKDVTAVASDAI